ncbi:MAG: hypothetical protein HY579_08655 [Nitrospinae bacterium]|nr:hypothetical protein [Nitrospinota bacterium]
MGKGKGEDFFAAPVKPNRRRQKGEKQNRESKKKNLMESVHSANRTPGGLAERNGKSAAVSS